MYLLIALLALVGLVLGAAYLGSLWLWDYCLRSHPRYKGPNKIARPRR
jgi:hypothetical protein